MNSKIFKVLSLFIIPLFILGLNACKDKDSLDTYTEEPTLSFGNLDGTAVLPRLEVSAETHTQKLTIASNGTWEVTKKSTNTDWLTVAPQEGRESGEITITVSKNTDENHREATLAFLVNGTEIKTYTIWQLGFGPQLLITPVTLDILPKDGSDISFNVAANDAWEYTVTDDQEWLTEKEKTPSSLTLTATKNMDSPRAANITFRLTNHPSATQTIELSQEGEISVIADLLDVQFNLDGSATDLSPIQHTVHKVSFDHPFAISYDETYQRNIVTFSPQANGVNPGANKGSWFRIDYDAAFESKLADGHSFECLIKFDVDYTNNRNYETKFFSTHESGGTGFLVANSSQPTGGNGLTFLPNVPAAQGGSSSWKWANSQVRPNGESWYHLIGIWDKEAGKAYIYVNGEKKSEVAALGYFRPVDGAEMRWIAIGGDPGRNNVLQLPFAGNLAIARIYNKALTETEATYLWNNVKINEN